MVISCHAGSEIKLALDIDSTMVVGVHGTVLKCTMGSQRKLRPSLHRWPNVSNHTDNRATFHDCNQLRQRSVHGGLLVHWCPSWCTCLIAQCLSKQSDQLVPNRSIRSSNFVCILKRIHEIKSINTDPLNIEVFRPEHYLKARRPL